MRSRGTVEFHGHNTIEFHGHNTVDVSPVDSSVSSSVPARTGLALNSSLTRSSDRPSNITIAQEIDPASYSLDQEDAPDPDDPAAMEADEDDAFGVGEVDLLADPASWHPFPVGSQVLRKEGRTIGFRTKSGIVFGP